MKIIKISLFLILTAFSFLAKAAPLLDTYHDLQNLKSDVRAAYIYALIVDKDARAHPQRNKKIHNIEQTLNKIDNLEHLDKHHKDALSLALRVYLRSAKNEAATFDERLGSRTLSNGFSAYSELIEYIYAPIQSIELEAKIPDSSVEVFTLLDKIAEAIELHGERTIKTERVENLTQNQLTTLCSSIEQGLINIAKYPDVSSTLRKAKLKWAFIKKPICELDKTSAPYAVTHYGEQMADILKEYAADKLLSAH